jgi:hypothetical protein
MVLSLFIKEKKDKEKKLLKIHSQAKKTVVIKIFYIETLKLKPEQIELFYNFDENDPKSKHLEDSND